VSTLVPTKGLSSPSHWQKLRIAHVVVICVIGEFIFAIVLGVKQSIPFQPIVKTNTTFLDRSKWKRLCCYRVYNSVYMYRNVSYIALYVFAYTIVYFSLFVTVQFLYFPQTVLALRGSYLAFIALALLSRIARRQPGSLGTSAQVPPLYLLAPLLW